MSTNRDFMSETERSIITLALRIACEVWQTTIEQPDSGATLRLIFEKQIAAAQALITRIEQADDVVTVTSTTSGERE